MKSRKSLLRIVFFLLIVFILWKSFSTPDISDLHGPYQVVRVTDGDTIVVEIDGVEYDVRMIGVDAPESVHPEEDKNTPAGADAASWTAELLEGTKVYLQYDIEKQDDYRRLLAYIYLEDGSTMVNQLLLENGHAEVMMVLPNAKYAVKFYTISTLQYLAELDIDAILSSLEDIANVIERTLT